MAMLKDRVLRNSAIDRISDRILDRDIYAAGSTLCNSSSIDDAALAIGTISQGLGSANESTARILLIYWGDRL